MIRPRSLELEAINKIATLLRCGFILWNHHGGFVVYFSCMIELVKKVILLSIPIAIGTKFLLI
jgi:hypothetical protein